MRHAKSHIILIAALLLAAGIKLWLFLSSAVPFNGDEAVGAVMARHILEGARPVFFYGQAYMGSNYAYLIAAGFALFGQKVGVMRFIEAVLYLIYMLTVWGIGRRFFKDKWVADIAVVLAAVPPLLVTTYTTVYFGTYGETLILGNVILLLGYEVIYGKYRDSKAPWLLLGAVSGFAFWNLGMAGVYILPVAAIGLWKLKWKPWMSYGLCAVGFVVGSMPWWLYNFNHEWAAWLALTEASLGPVTTGQRIFGLIFFGIPAVLGLRPPWTATYLPWPVVFLWVYLFLGATIYMIKGEKSGETIMNPGSRGLLMLLTLVFCGFFAFSHYGVDATGRFFLPLYLPVNLFLAAFIAAARRQKPAFAMIILAAALGLNGYATWLASNSEERITTQFDPIAQIDNQHDAALIAFLDEEGELRGYSNYWVSYRLAFLSGERLIFAARIPYRADLSYTTRDDRYPAYTELVEKSGQTAYITTNHPELNGIIAQGLLELDVSFDEIDIGDYHIFYHLDRAVRPTELGLGVPYP
ncbi:MAG: glycosyltransferase family 39 protein [Anaerolineae bacterium]|nr:glycosyltransferase family 39 protein [Anaerolineae bacterium]